MKYGRHRLSFSFLLPVLLSALVVMALMTAYDIRNESSQLNHDLTEKGDRLLDLAAASAQEAFWNYNETSLRNIGDILKDSDDVATVSLLDEAGNITYLSQKNGPIYAENYLLSIPPRTVKHGDNKVGEIRLTFTRYYLQQSINQSMWYALLKMALVLIVLLLTVRMLTRNLTRSVDHIQAGVIAFSEGKQDSRIAVNTRTEIGRLADRLNTMFDVLVDARDKLNRNYQELLDSRETLRITEERYRFAVEGSNDMIWDWNVLTDSYYLSPRSAQLIGIAGTQEIGMEEWMSFIAAQDRDDYRQFLEDFRTHPDNYAQLQFRLIGVGGETRWLFCRGKGILDSNRQLIRVSGFCTDITERIRAEESIHRLAYYDKLTGLPNRTTLLNQLDTQLCAKDSQISGSMLYLDLDGFKIINDTKGHMAGDRVLSAVAAEFVKRIHCQMIARIGGDEFAFLKAGCDALEISRTAEQILQCLRQGWEIDNTRFDLTGSVGVVRFPADGGDVDTLLMNADNAMYQAKRAGGDQYRFYEQSMNERMVQRLQLQHDMREALVNREFVLFYQPQIDVRSGSVVGVEALVRWQHPTRGLLPPGEFIGLAEESGMILRLGADLLREACEQSVRWERMGIRGIRVSVNMSARQFVRREIIQEILNTVAQTGMDRSLLCIEITESIAMENLQSAVEIMGELKANGIRFSLDDFGTGYSSLNYLKNLPIDEIKIDRAFMQNVVQGSFETIVVSSLIQIAHSMGLIVVAEGIETSEQHGVLVGFQCDHAQGYLYSRPVPAEQVQELLGQKLM